MVSQEKRREGRERLDAVSVPQPKTHILLRRCVSSLMRFIHKSTPTGSNETWFSLFSLSRSLEILFFASRRRQAKLNILDDDFMLEVSLYFVSHMLLFSSLVSCIPSSSLFKNLWEFVFSFFFASRSFPSSRLPLVSVTLIESRRRLFRIEGKILSLLASSSVYDFSWRLTRWDERWVVSCFLSQPVFLSP